MLAGKIFTTQGFRWTISSFLLYKSPYGDNIIPVQIQMAIEIILPKLIDIDKNSFSMIYTLGMEELPYVPFLSHWERL